MERAEVAKATGYAGEMEVELRLLREDQEQVRSSTVPSIETSCWSQLNILPKTP